MRVCLAETDHSTQQDSFRQLLQTPRPGASGTPTARGSLLGFAKKPTASTKASNEPAFKPRNIKKDKDGDKKKKDAKWRDRAAERREGKEGDFADVEAVLKEFEKRNEGEEDVSYPFFVYSSACLLLCLVQYTGNIYTLDASTPYKLHQAASSPFHSVVLSS